MKRKPAPAGNAKSPSNKEYYNKQFSASRTGELQRVGELLGQLETKRNDAEAKVGELSSEVDSLTEKYTHGPIPLGSAEDDLRRSEGTKNRAADSAAFLNNLKDWLAQEMPDNEAAQTEVQQRIDAIEQLDKRLAELRQPLLDEVERERHLLAEQNALLDQLDHLENQAIQASETLEPTAFEAIQQSLRPIRDQLEKLNNEANIPSNLVQHGDLLNLPAVAERVDALEAAKDASVAKMAFARLAGKISRETAELRDNLR